MKHSLNTRLIKGITFTLLLVMSLSPYIVKGENYYKENFVLNDESVQYLDIENNDYYNGSISLTVTVGANVTGIVNELSKTVALGETAVFQIVNVTTLVFTLTTEGSTQGYFEVSLILLSSGANRSVYITLAILGAIAFLFVAISFFVRSKKYQRKPDEEDEEMVDSQTLKKRKEAAGAEKKFWGFRDNR